MTKSNREIELCSGEYLDLLNPDPDMITPQVLAHHLAQCNRYAGAPKRPYSVAEHCLLVARFLEFYSNDPWVVLAGLHHDDAEAFLHDITRPLKDQIPTYKPIERKMAYVIQKALGFSDCTEEEVRAIKAADNWALSCEAWYLMPSRGIGWWCQGIFDPGNEDHVQIARPIAMAEFLMIDGAASVERHWLRQHYRIANAVTVND